MRVSLGLSISGERRSDGLKSRGWKETVERREREKGRGKEHGGGEEKSAVVYGRREGKVESDLGEGRVGGGFEVSGE